MLTREQRDKWADALESGEYEQGIGNFMTVGSQRPKFCCLGVLGKVCRVPLIYDEIEKLLLDTFPQGMHIEGLKEIQPNYEYFVQLNDCHRLSFKQIATIVRTLPVVEDSQQLASPETAS